MPKVTIWQQFAEQRRVDLSLQSDLEAVKKLKGSERNQFLLHDSRLMFTRLSATLGYARGIPIIEEFKQAITINEGQIASAANILKIANQIGLEEFTNAAQRAESTVNTEFADIVRFEGKMWPLTKKFLSPLIYSLKFLDKPNSTDLQNLARQQIKLSELAEYFGAGLTGPDRELDGMEFITFFNLLRNAKDFEVNFAQTVENGGPNRLSIASSEQGISIQNRSQTDLPDPNRLFQLGGKGGSNLSNKGYGLFIAKLYSKIKGDTLEATSLPIDSGYAISFNYRFSTK